MITRNEKGEITAVEKLSWKGFEYTPKPFTIGNYYSLIEGYVDNVSIEIGGKTLHGSFARDN